MYSKTLAITNRKLYKGDFLAQIEKITSLGVKGIILREKDLAPANYEKLAQKVLAITEKTAVPLIIHSHIEVARNLNCPKIHLPLVILQEYHQNLGDFQVIGASCHSLEEAQKAVALGATYITAGHIFPTDCKKGLEPKGLDFLSKITAAINIPVYALGGITPQNAESALTCGAAGIGMMSFFAT